MVKNVATPAGEEWTRGALLGANVLGAGIGSGGFASATTIDFSAAAAAGAGTPTNVLSTLIEGVAMASSAAVLPAASIPTRKARQQHAIPLARANFVMFNAPIIRGVDHAYAYASRPGFCSRREITAEPLRAG